MRASVLMACVCVAVALAGTSAARAATADEQYVDVELVLAVDVSGSMDRNEQRIQRSGYVAAFRSPEVQRAITSGPYGRIAVTYVEWAGAFYQRVVVPWFVIASDQDARTFSELLMHTALSREQRTSISSGLVYAASAFSETSFVSDRRTIDVSGDGANNDGVPVVPTRDRLVADGITINGLPILINPSPLFGDTGPVSLEDYYRACVIGGPGAFILTVESPDQFESAIRRKLVLEIAGLPLVTPAAATEFDPELVDCLAGEKSRARGFAP